MVNLSEFEKQFYTPAELSKLDRDMAAMEMRENEQQKADAEYAARPFKNRKLIYTRRFWKQTRMNWR